MWRIATGRRRGASGRRVSTALPYVARLEFFEIQRRLAFITKYFETAGRLSSETSTRESAGARRASEVSLQKFWLFPQLGHSRSLFTLEMG